MKTECAICGKMFEPKSHNAKTCSGECSKELHKRMAKKNRQIKNGWKPLGMGECIICGKSFQKKAHNAKTCSEECRKEHERRRYDHKPLGMVECVICGKLFQQTSHNSNTCSEECRKEQKQRRAKKSWQAEVARRKQAEMERRTPKRSKLDRFTGEIARYNRNNGTNLSYGMYVLYKEMGKL